MEDSWRTQRHICQGNTTTTWPLVRHDSISRAQGDDNEGGRLMRSRAVDAVDRELHAPHHSEHDPDRQSALPSRSRRSPEILVPRLPNKARLRLTCRRSSSFPLRPLHSHPVRAVPLGKLGNIVRMRRALRRPPLHASHLWFNSHCTCRETCCPSGRVALLPPRPCEASMMLDHIDCGRHR